VDVRGYETPEEAVLAELDVPRRYFNVVGVRVCGDEAWVYLLTNDRPAYAEYTCVCFREQGLWTEAYGDSAEPLAQASPGNTGACHVIRAPPDRGWLIADKLCCD